MRKTFFELLEKQMDIDPDIVLLTGDVGFGLMDDMRVKYPTRFINCMAAEQTMIGVAIGMALSGKKPVCYTISPFLLKGFEVIDNYLEYEGIAVTLVGSGRGKDYLQDGYTHWEKQWPFKKVKAFYPDIEDLEELIKNIGIEPIYINLKR